MPHSSIGEHVKCTIRGTIKTGIVLNIANFPWPTGEECIVLQIQLDDGVNDWLHEDLVTSI